MLYISLLLLIFSYAFPVELKRECFEVIEDVLYCKSVITKESLVPQVCGKCELEAREGKLYIRQAKGCPKYDALACQLKSGEFFLINNLSCKPVSEKGKESKGEIHTKGKEKTYRVKVTGEFCFTLLKKRFEVLKEERDEALIKASPNDLKHLPHCVYSYEEE